MADIELAFDPDLIPNNHDKENLLELINLKNELDSQPSINVANSSWLSIKDQISEYQDDKDLLIKTIEKEENL